MQYVQSRGKSYYSINQYPVVDAKVMNWVLACYLIGKQHAAAIFVTIDKVFQLVTEKY